ncbi:putative FAD binding domain-containing protein [Rosellinia necatrix]|uniref:Putative FAD binding domain-containing protein n=1 Tax=Rosellinia necatrix TaxID=77044 RepID=A0A1W2TV78_ROSNE|nr:putative FAD binding domain-containing protein [Rosellinia necatrix]
MSSTKFLLLRGLSAGMLAGAACAVSELPIVSLSDGASCACSELTTQYGSEILGVDSTNYTTEITNYWDIRANLSPSCIFLPADADQVANAVSIISSCGAQFAIRGGGHMNYPGSNNINGGVLLGLNSLTDIKVNSDNATGDATIELGPGNRWVDVYNALQPYGLYAVGGRLKTIGVPGLSLIGGFHYFNNKYGMTMDQHISYDVVLGNGTQVVANATSNPDLFWALKGGGSNFGIVTKFTMKAYSIPLVSTTIQTFNESGAEDFITATVNLAENNPPDIAAGCVLSITYNATTKDVSASLLGVEDSAISPPSRFANFSAIPSEMAINRVISPAEWHSPLESPNQLFRIQFVHKTMKPDATQLYAIYNAWKEAVDKISDVEGLYPTFVLNPMFASSATPANTNGVGNVWGLSDDQSYILWQLSTGWANAEDDLRMSNWANSFVNYWHSINKDLGISSEFLYMGDSSETQDPFPGFPLENVQRMRDVRAAYDPLGVFSRLNWGGFKLSM